MTLVWIASYPRSGNTFARHIVEYLTGQITYSIYPEMDTLGKRAWFPDDTQGERGPVFVKTHRDISSANTPYPAIYLIRDGRDALVSHAHYIVRQYAKQGESWDYLNVLKRLCGGHASTGDIACPEYHWSANVMAWIRRDAPTAFIRMERLIADPLGEMKRAFDSLRIDLPISEDAREYFDKLTFDNLNRMQPDIFHKGKSGTWKSEMPQGTLNLFWQVHGQAMNVLGYDRGEE